jgi:hypothetical protein
MTRRELIAAVSFTLANDAMIGKKMEILLLIPRV